MLALLVAGSAACRQADNRTAAPAAAPVTSGAASATAARRAPATERPRRYVDLGRLEGRTVVLLTHPVPHVLASLREVVDDKLLAAVPELFVVGVFHGDEVESYQRSFAYLRRHRLDWVGLKRIGCPLEPGDLYRRNPCSETFRRLFERSRGIIFTGGADIPPALYGERTRLLTVIRTPRRQYWEISLLFHLLGGSQDPRFVPLLARRPDHLVLGICMGMQAMNVAAGGTLHQDILSEIYGVQTFEQALELRADQLHRNPRYDLDPQPDTGVGVYHPIRFTGARELWQELAPEGQPVSVMSIHHQSLARLARDLEVIATSVDGKVVEAVRHRRFPRVLGVQFHPEYHFLAKSAATATGRMPRYARPVTDEPSRAFHRRFWQIFVAGGLRAAPVKQR